MVVLGIDWGTTNSCVSYYNPESKQFVVIPNDQGDLVSPSVISFDPEVVCGIHVPNTLSKIKRLVGQDRLFQVKPDVYLSVPQIIVYYLNYLKKYAMTFLEYGPDVDTVDTVITVPVYYNDHQREIIKSCFEECKMNVIRIINEPTAAALAYTIDLKETEKANEYILVFDCGGGTTDLSLLYLDHSSQVYEVKSVIGDNFLGGEDITQALAEYLGLKVTPKVIRACEKLKCELSFRENATIHLELGDTDYSRTISRSQFLDITRPFFKKIKQLITNLMKDVTFQIKKVIFVGGTTRIPYFKDLFKEILGHDIIIHCDLDPDTTVSLGAAVQGALIEDSLEGELGDTLLLDIIPLSLGVETAGGIMTPIISRNSILPISKTQDFKTTDSTTDSIIEIAVYQGERKFVRDNFLLTKFNIKNVENLESSNVVVSVTFDISLDGIITASAKIKGGEEVESIKITNESTNSVERHEHLLEAEMNKISDSEKANQIHMKNELYDSFKKLLGIFHDYSNVHLDSEYTKNELNKLFNETFYIIEEFENYTPSQLLECKTIFEETWHRLVFEVGGSEVGGTQIAESP